MHPIHGNISEIYSGIIKQFTEDFFKFLTQLSKIEKDPKVYKFVEKYIQWYSDKDTEMMCYRMFREVIYQGDFYFFSSLNSFIDNYLYDDSYFVVKWYRTEMDNDNSEIIYVECDKEDMFAFPIVKADDDNGTQNPQVLLDAMTQFEINENKLKEFHEEMGFEYK
jgi:hypothetical protein